MSDIKLNCDVVNDLLPLYIDDVLSENSREAVAAHLMKCKKCQKVVEEMSRDIDAEVSVADRDSELFRNVCKKFRKKYVRRAVIILAAFLILWVGVSIYLMNTYKPIYPKAEVNYINECLEIVEIDGELYVHQTDMFAQGEVIIISSAEGEINFYLGENGIHNLGFGRSFYITPQFQKLSYHSETGDVSRVNYCKPDGTVITTLWQEGESLKILNAVSE